MGQEAPGWDADAPGPLVLAALLRACGPGTLRALLPAALQVLHGCIASPDRRAPPPEACWRSGRK